MTVVIRSLINMAQTLDSVALGPWAVQHRNRSTTELAAAVTARTIQMDEITADPVDAEINVQYEAPLTGATLTAGVGCEAMIVDQAGTIAALTLNLPASPKNGQTFEVSFDEVVTALTMAAPASATIKDPLTAATAGGFAKWRYNKGDNSWYRFG